MKVTAMSDDKVVLADGKRKKSVLVIGKAAGTKMDLLDKATRKLRGKVNKRYAK